MAKGEVVLKEELCTGCSYCVKFCNRSVLSIGSKFNGQGYVVAEVSDPANCNACGLCARMCPHFIIEVYKYV